MMESQIHQYLGSFSFSNNLEDLFSFSWARKEESCLATQEEQTLYVKMLQKWLLMPFYVTAMLYSFALWPSIIRCFL